MERGDDHKLLHMQNRSITIFLAIAALALLSLCTWRLISEPGPRWHGKSIASYVEQLTAQDDGTISFQERQQSFQAAAAALRQMGLPAVAWLAQRLERKEPLWQTRYRGLWQALPPIGRKVLPQPAEAPGPRSSKDLLDGHTLRALAQVGPGAVPVLTNYLDASRYGSSTRLQVYHTLCDADFRHSAADALPLLEHNLTASNTMDRILSAYVMFCIDPKRTEQAVAVLREALTSSEDRLGAAMYLGNMGKAAKAAAPDLEALLDDPDPTLRYHARSALKRVTGKQKGG